MPIDYGLQNINVAGMSQEYFSNARKIAELEFEATMKQNAKLEKALTLENTSKLFGQMTSDVNADYEQLNKDLAKKLRASQEAGSGYLTPMDWGAVNTLKQRITDKVTKYNTFIDAYQKASEELISNPKKYHGRTSKDNLLSFSESPLDYINAHKSATFLTPSLTNFDEIIGKYQSVYKDNTSYTKEEKKAYGKARTSKFEGNISMFNTDQRGKVVSLKDDKSQLFTAVENLIGLAKGNDEFNRSMQMTYEDIKQLDPTKIAQIDNQASVLYPNDPEKQAYARGALMVVDTNNDFYRARSLEGEKIVREPKATGAGKGAPKIVGKELGVWGDYTATGYVTGKVFSGQGFIQDVGKTRPINTAGSGGSTIKFTPETIVDNAPGKRQVKGRSFIPAKQYFDKEDDAIAFTAREGIMGDLGIEGDKIVAIPKPINVKGKVKYEVTFLKPVRDIIMGLDEFNRQSPDFKIAEQSQEIRQALINRQKSKGQQPSKAAAKGKGGGSKPAWLK